jgi:predicted ester cyclase
MAAADSKSLVQDLQRDIDTGRAEILDKYLSPTYDDHNPPPFASKAPGRTGVKETFTIALDIFSDFKHVVEDQVAEGDKVATRISGSGKHVGPFLGIPPTNKMVTMSGIAIHRVADGRLVEHWGYVDAVGLLVQMGVMPAPPALPPLPPPPPETGSNGVVLDAEQMKQTVRRMFEEGINRRNRAVMDELLHPAYVNYSMPMTAPGAQGLDEVLNLFFTAFPDMHIVVEDVFGENDKAVSRGQMTGTHQGPFMNVPATGRAIKIGYIDIWKARGGRLIENWVQLDMLDLLIQLGAIPAPQA